MNKIKKFIGKKLIQLVEFLVKKYDIKEADILERLKAIKERDND